MRDGGGFVMPLGALATAFVAVLVLGTTYNFLQPAAAQPKPDPGNAAVTTGGPPSSASPATITTLTVSAAPATATDNTDSAGSPAAPGTAGGEQAGQAQKPPPPYLLRLGGDPRVLQTVYQAGLTATVNDKDEYAVAASATPLPDQGRLTKLCLTTPALVKFAIGGKPGKQQDRTTCFTQLDKAKLLVEVTPA